MYRKTPCIKLGDGEVDVLSLWIGGLKSTFINVSLFILDRRLQNGLHSINFYYEKFSPYCSEINSPFFPKQIHGYGGLKRVPLTGSLWTACPPVRMGILIILFKNRPFLVIFYTPWRSSIILSKVTCWVTTTLDSPSPRIRIEGPELYLFISENFPC